MKKLILIAVPVAILLGGVYFFSDWGKQTRLRLWRAFDQDVLYLQDNTYIRGWIWTETEEAIMGKRANGAFFTVKRLELRRIERNLLLAQLKQIL